MSDALKIMKLSNQERAAELARDIATLDRVVRTSKSTSVSKQLKKLIKVLEWHMKQEERTSV